MSEMSFLSICAIADSYEHSLTIDRILYEMTGDLECAAILSRLRYWFSPSRETGQLRARSRHEGKVWLYRKDDEWEEEACVRVKQMPRVKKQLKKLGLVEIAIFKANGNPTTHWNLNIQKFTEMYNEILQKKISKYPDGEKPNPPLEKKETPQSGNSINKHITQASYTSSLKHICPDGGDALSKMNEMGYVEYLPPMRGKLKNDYTELNADQKHAFSLLVSVPPVSEDDQRVNPVTAVNVVRNYSIDAIRKAILFYQQKLEEGLHPKNTGALVLDFLGKRLEPLPPQASTNKSFWEKHKHHYPPGSYEEHQRCIVIKRIDRELSFAMSHDVFVEQFKRNLEMYKDQ